MSLQAREKRALLLLVPAVAIWLIIEFWPSGSAGPAVVAPVDNVAAAERRLQRLREIAATVPAKEEMLKGVSADLALREKGLILADTAAQAQAQVLQVLRRVAKDASLDIRPVEMAPIRPLGDNYGEATVSVQIDCRIDQLVNLLAGLTAQSELIATDEIHIISQNSKQKTLVVRLTVSGVVPKRLVPEKKGVAF